MTNTDKLDALETVVCDFALSMNPQKALIGQEIKHLFDQRDMDGDDQTVKDLKQRMKDLQSALDEMKAAVKGFGL